MINRDEWILNHQNPMISRKKWQTTLDFIARLYEAPAACLLQATSAGIQVVIRSQNNSKPLSEGDRFNRGEKSFLEQTLTSQQLLYVNQATHDPVWKETDLVRDNSINSFLGIPINWPDGSAFGLLCIFDFAITHYSKMFLGLTSQFRDMIEPDLLLNNQFIQLLDLSTKDDLSQLLNRQGFFLQAEKHVHLAQRLDKSVGIMSLDLDDLRQVNETHGHHMGDKAISALGKAIGNVLRESDVAGRFDGDEFMIVALDQEANGLHALSERIRKEFQRLTSEEMAQIPLSISIASQSFSGDQIARVDMMVSATSAHRRENKFQDQRRLG